MERVQNGEWIVDIELPLIGLAQTKAWTRETPRIEHRAETSSRAVAVQVADRERSG